MPKRAFSRIAILTALITVLAACQLIDDVITGDADASLELATAHSPASGLTATPPTGTATLLPQCTAPACQGEEVFYCPGDCPGGCGIQCATPTPERHPRGDELERIELLSVTAQAERSGTLAAGASKLYLVEAEPGQATWFRMIAEDGPVNVAVRLDGDTIAEDSVYNDEFASFWVEGKVFAPTTGEIVFVLTNLGDADTIYRLSLELTD